jgi:Endoribonuclease GhoS
MANFTVRVELHHAQWSDYNQLHTAMERAGFSRQITSDDGSIYQMPWAEYNGAGNLTSPQVRDIAKAAADTTGKQSAVLVTEAVSRAWIGLSASA